MAIMSRRNPVPLERRAAALSAGQCGCQPCQWLRIDSTSPGVYCVCWLQIGRGGNGNMELLGRSQEPPQAAGDVPNVGGYRDAPESAGLVAAAMGGARRTTRDSRSDGV